MACELNEWKLINMRSHLLVTRKDLRPASFTELSLWRYHVFYVTYTNQHCLGKSALPHLTVLVNLPNVQDQLKLLKLESLK